MGILARLDPRVRKRAVIGLLSALVLGLVTIDWLSRPPLVPSFADLKSHWQPSEAWLYDRDGHVLDELRVDFNARRLAWTPVAAISPALSDAVIRAEDRRFLRHGGVDWLATAGSLRARAYGHKARGASTITMQLAAFLSPRIARPGSRSLLDKLRQARAAWAIESQWSKAEVLEGYLNLVPLRGETQGVGAGALMLFGKAPGALDRREAAVMAALLPDPGASSLRVGERACRLMPAADCPALQALADSTASPGRLRTIDPGLAPHLAAHLLTEPGMKVTTTLDPRVQALAVTALRHQLQGLGARRVRDGAVVVLDNASGEVLAYVGGVGLGSTAAAVDGASALRQAGSTLKPHLYAQLIEKKWLTAASILEDSPVQLDTASGLYVPRNYDNAFMGPVTVRRALANSLNVPAVRALLLDGVQPFRDRLWDLGYTGLQEDGSYYGYSLALG
ncbi:MAG: transglycosylase domain-containing protein, partial [Novosphingobium sp.]